MELVVVPVLDDARKWRTFYAWLWSDRLRADDAGWWHDNTQWWSVDAW